jgi:sigma-54-specific transcriptional regulator
MSELHPAKLLSFPHAGEARSAARSRALVCSDQRALEVLRQLDRLAASEVTILLAGETGTGKEVAARRVHELSRPGGPFVAVNCGAFSESLVEAELFGHEAGAFTGAQQARAGWFEAAQGGTLFLDEIGDMPLSLQVKLLRVLQERQVVRVGSRKPIPVDVRVVVGTNVDLRAAVEDGKFRRDLYYRVSVAPVRLLPLRERRADVLPLAQHFLELYARRLGFETARLTAGAEQALLAYEWPGNIRELENAVQYGLIMSTHGLVQAADLSLGIGAAAGAAAGAAPAMAEDDALAALAQGVRRLLESGHPNVYESVERVLINTAFEFCEGNQVHTARRLGISRNVVRAQLKRFDLLPDRQVCADGAFEDEETALMA